MFWLADDLYAQAVRDVDTCLVDGVVDKDIDDGDGEVDRDERVVIGDEHARILHQVGVAHHVCHRGVFDYHNELRDE